MYDDVIRIGLKFCGVVLISVIGFSLLFSFINYSNMQNHKINNQNQNTQVIKTN